VILLDVRCRADDPCFELEENDFEEDFDEKCFNFDEDLLVEE